MSHRIVPAAFEHVEEAFDVALHVDVRVFQRVPHARLSAQMDDGVVGLRPEDIFHGRTIGEIDLPEREVAVRGEIAETALLERDLVVIVKAVDADNVAAGLQIALGNMVSDEAGGSGQQDGFHSALPRRSDDRLTQVASNDFWKYQSSGSLDESLIHKMHRARGYVVSTLCHTLTR